MSHTRTKVCGITREADLQAAVDAGTDAVGLIVDVSVDTPREVGVDRAAELADAAPPFVSVVLVTMASADGDRVRELVDRVGPDAVQVHGDPTPSAVTRLTRDLAVDVLVAVDAANPKVARYDDVADAVLLDSLTETGAGGTGETVDWERTKGVLTDLDAPVVLAGGLTPENVAEAVDTVSPFGVDVASGVERDGECGVKDHDAVRAFVTNARRVDPSGLEVDR